MRAFDYASPTTKEQAVALLGTKWGETEVLAGGMDLLSLMKDHIAEPKRIVNIKEIKELEGVKYRVRARAFGSAPWSPSERSITITVKKGVFRAVQAAEGVTSPQIRNLGTVGGRPLPAAPLLVLPQRLGPARPGFQRQVVGYGGGKQVSRHPRELRPRIFCKSFQPGSGSYRARRQNSECSAPKVRGTFRRNSSS